MATTATSPNNAKVTFKGKPMAKEKSAGIAAAPAADKDYEAEDALRTMTRAEEHQGDKDLMKRVGSHVQKQAASLSKVQAKLQAQGLISDKQAEKMAKRAAK
jgi:hypothetical protein